MAILRDIWRYLVMWQRCRSADLIGSAWLPTGDVEWVPLIHLMGGVGATLVTPGDTW